jgi:hypothetical protein
MLNFASGAGFASVSSFAKRSFGSSWRAVFSKNGAMARHGPHQGAQKSTTSGKSPRLTCLSKFADVSVTGVPSNSAKRQFGQRGDSLKRSSGRRTTESQCPQTTWINRPLDFISAPLRG